MEKSLLAAPLQPAIETAVKKIAIAAPLQPATETVETAVKKIVIAAPLQPATETAVKKIVIAAPLVDHRNSSQKNRDSCALAATHRNSCQKNVIPFMCNFPSLRSLLTPCKNSSPLQLSTSKNTLPFSRGGIRVSVTGSTFSGVPAHR